MKSQPDDVVEEPFAYGADKYMKKQDTFLVSTLSTKEIVQDPFHENLVH